MSIMGPWGDDPPEPPRFVFRMNPTRFELPFAWYVDFAEKDIEKYEATRAEMLTAIEKAKKG